MEAWVVLMSGDWTSWCTLALIPLLWAGWRALLHRGTVLGMWEYGFCPEVLAGTGTCQPSASGKGGLY